MRERVTFRVPMRVPSHRDSSILSLSPSSPVENGSRLDANTTEMYKERLLRFAREAEVNKRGRATALSRLIGKDLLARACGGSGLKLKFDCRLPGTVFAAIVSPSALHRGKSRHDGEGLVETTWRPTMFADRPTREIPNERVCVRAPVQDFAPPPDRLQKFARVREPWKLRDSRNETGRISGATTE